MRCPHCGGKLRHMHTWTESVDGIYVNLRRYECKKCSRKWQSEENILGEETKQGLKLFGVDEKFKGLPTGEPWYMVGAFKRAREREDEH